MKPVEKEYNAIISLLAEMEREVERLIKGDEEMEAYLAFIRKKDTVLESEIDMDKLVSSDEAILKRLKNHKFRVVLEISRMDRYERGNKDTEAYVNMLNFLNAFPRRIKKGIYGED